MISYYWTTRQPVLKISLDCSREADNLGAKMAIQVFRVIQECLTNTVRHAKATHAHIHLTIDKNGLHLKVSDNGQGYVNSGKTGFGLLGMKERVNSLGGIMNIQSQAQQGTRILVNIPLS